MMKNKIGKIKKGLLLFLLIGIGTSMFAQRYAYIDSKYVLEHIPDYKDAQQKLDQFSMEWQQEIEAQYSNIDKMYKDYQADQILLTDDMKQKRQKEIEEKEKSVKDLQKQYFGPKGLLFQKREELVKPIQDKIYKAVKEIAQYNRYSIVFDKAGSLTMLYTDPKYDKSDDVLKKLGYTP